MSVAQAALDRGCVIYRHTYEDGRWRLIPGTTLDVVQPDCREYYFHICILRAGTKGRLQIGVAGMPEWFGNGQTLTGIQKKEIT